MSRTEPRRLVCPLNGEMDVCDPCTYGDGDVAPHGPIEAPHRVEEWAVRAKCPKHEIPLIPA